MKWHVISVQSTLGQEEDDRPKIAIVGKPNVGKSSIINKLTGENRVIVSDIAGTTRDAVDTEVKHNGTEYVFIPYLFTISKKHLSTFLLGYTIIGTILLSISPCTNFKQEIVAPPIIVLCKINNNFITTILT